MHMNALNGRGRAKGIYLPLVLALFVTLSIGWPGHVQVTHASSADYAENQITVTLAPGTDITSFNAAHGTSTAESLPDERTYVLALPVTESADTAASQWASDPSITTVE